MKKRPNLLYVFLDQWRYQEIMKKRPNLLYVFLDQWRYQAMGYAKEDEVCTPHMDSFARESLDCTEAVSTFPLCSPHRASLLTGKYPFSVGMWTNCKIGLSEILMLKPQETCIGNVLKDTGYHTGYIGKWHLDASEQNFEKNPVSGAKDWDAYTPPGERRQGFDYWLSYGACDEHLTPHYWADTPKPIIDCTEAVSTFPLCSPHRASLLTGKYPFSVGMWTNCKIGLSEILMLKPQEICIGNVLKDTGYHTGYIGKWHLDASEQNFEKNPVSGAKDWDAYTPPGERRQGFDYWLSYGACDEHLTPHYWADTPKQIRPNCWSPEFETDKALEYMEGKKHETDKALEYMEGKKQQEEPFALFVSYNPPHLPYELVPDKYYEKYKDMLVHFRENVPKEKRTPEMETITRQYFAAVSGVDEQFGRLLDFLKKNHMEEDTIVVLSADHGEMLGSHGRMSKNVWYEESIHIPLYIRQKGRLAPAKYKELVASPDHMPTLLGLLDIPVPDTCQGFNHAPGILGQENDAPKDAFLCSYPGMPEMVAAFEKQGLNSKCYGWRGIRTHTHTFVINNGYKPGEKQVKMLYNNEKDPYQQNPIMITELNEELAADYEKRLREYLDMQQDPFLM